MLNFASVFHAIIGLFSVNISKISVCTIMKFDTVSEIRIA
jgi:hypothetical protein